MNKTLEIINDLEKERKERNISRESIEFISIICGILKPKNILEIGTFNGYSALWLSSYSNKVISLEKDERSVILANDNLRKAGCKNVEIIHGDAVEVLKKLDIKFDIVLIDAMKSQYKKYLEYSLMLLNKNGLIFIDNTISHKEHLDDFFEYLMHSDLYYKELNLGKGLMLITKNDKENL